MTTNHKVLEFRPAHSSRTPPGGKWHHGFGMKNLLKLQGEIRTNEKSEVTTVDRFGTEHKTIITKHCPMRLTLGEKVIGIKPV